jgi:O-antigen/teichoic acid export membrane protein
MAAGNASVQRALGIGAAIGAIRRLVRRLRGADLAWARGAGGSGALSAIARVIGLGNAVLMARLLQPAGYGLYSFAYAIAGALAIPAQFGIPTVVIREVAAGQSLGRWGLARGVVRWAHAGVVAFSAVISAGAVAMLVWRAPSLSGTELVTYVAAILLVPLLALDSLRGAVLTGLGRVVLGRLPGELLRPLIMFAVLIAAAIAVPSLVGTAAEAMVWMTVAAACAYVIGGWILYRVRPPALTQAKAAYLVRRWSISALPIGFNSGLAMLNQYVGMLILGALASKVEVGEYRVAVLGASLVVMGLGALNSAFAPYYARSAAAGDRQSLQRFATRSAQLALLLAVPLVFAYAVFGTRMIHLSFGGAYGPAFLPLMILVIGATIDAATGSVGLILYMSQHETDVTLSFAVAATVNIVGALLLVPRLGMAGAAAAAAASEIAWNLVCCWRVWQRLKVVPGPIAIRMTRSVP